MSGRPAQRPEGKLIERAQKRSSLSQRQAAPLAGISENHWRNIVKGYSTVSAGVTAPIRGHAETVARMAQVVGVTPEQLTEAGRDDAAVELRALPPIEHTGPEPTVAELRAEIEAERAKREVLERRIVEIERRERERIQEQTLDESA